MEKAELKIDYFLYEDSFPGEYDALCRAARAATENAYSVYSGFSVGAAVLTGDGTIVTGSNQENVAYPSGLCAERVALFHACSEYPHAGVKAIAIAARNRGVEVDECVTPCGACRQVMSEIVRRYQADFDVILLGRHRTLLVKASQLLPFAFEM